MSRPQKKILVTNALPYANGPIHIGHLVGYIQADIWVRFQRLRGNQVTFVCADDAHGTPIMLAAEKAGVAPEEFVAHIRADHERDFQDFLVAFDHYHTTHSSENRELAERIYAALVEGDYIEHRTIEQAYDPEKNMFLPDRYVKGECPRCGTPDQYGDNCENCGATYSPRDLKHPRSAVSGAIPEWRPSEHFFFKLETLQAEIETWLRGTELHESVRAKLREWLDAGLKNWDISRDAPYFGFEIPGAPGKYFYVWLDAPIGYFASLQAYCAQQGLDFESFIQADSPAEMWHFIGKDIVNFHGLFWPGMLIAAGLRTPTGLSVNGYLTVNGAKMSKSRGTFIMARTYLDHVKNPEYLRYYYAAKLGAGVEDIDLNLEDFVFRVNSDLVGKVVNIASRCAGFINKRFGGELGEPDFNTHVEYDSAFVSDEIADLYEAREYRRVARKIMELADSANQYVDAQKPWELAKQPDKASELHAVCSTALALFRDLVIYLAPILPRLAEGAQKFLNLRDLEWEHIHEPLRRGHRINTYKPLMTRIEPSEINAMTEASTENYTAHKPADTTAKPALKTDPIGPEIAYEDFAKLDLRLAEIVQAQPVEGADKLLKLRVDLGGETRTIFAGIKQAYTPEQLIGRLTIVVANLAPRKMRFGVSEGMVLAAGPGGKEIYLLKPDAGARAGMRVK
jgi:methionyl-tRNA synthetase